MIPMDNLAIINHDNCILGKGSHGKVVEAILTNTSISQMPLKVAVKVMVAEGPRADSDLAALLDECIKEVEIVLDLEAKIGAQSTDRLIYVIGIARGPLPPSFEDEFGKRKKAVAIVMRLEAGGTLMNLLESSNMKGLGAVEKLHLVLQLSRGLAEIHEAGVVHGDIKACNIFLSHHNPPLVRFGDFGESTMNSSKSLGFSTLKGTLTKHGTPLYSAPEMLAPDSSGFRAKPSRKTDVYAFGLVCFEILCKDHKTFFESLANEGQLIEEVVVKGKRPDLANIQADVPDSLKRTIEACWDVNRNERPTALSCYHTALQCYNVLSSSKYDIFLSHLWNEKHYVQYIFHFLNTIGYRVWYDINDMDHKRVDSMKKGIEDSKVVLICLHRDYEKSKNCMLELDHAVSSGKTIVVLVTDEEFWSPNSWASQDIIDKLGLHGQGNLFIDISKICINPDWKPSTKAIDNYLPPLQLKKDLYSELDKLAVLLRKPQIDCQPSL